MKFGIIICDDDANRGGHLGFGQYYFGRYDDSINDWQLIYAVKGEVPDKEQMKEYAGFVTSGSRHSVNDTLPWMLQLEEFFRNIIEHNRCEERKIRLFAVCFGHQLLCRALGGRISNNTSGEFVFGVESMTINDSLVQEPYFKSTLANNWNIDVTNDANKQEIRMIQSHGEWVSHLPVNAKIVAWSKSCPHEVLFYGDDKLIISTQGHPEYTPSLSESRMDYMRKKFEWTDESVLSRRHTLVDMSNKECQNWVDFVRRFLMHQPKTKLD